MGVVQGEPARGGVAVLGAAERLRRVVLSSSSYAKRPCARKQTKRRERGARGSEGRGGDRRRRHERAVAERRQKVARLEARVEEAPDAAVRIPREPVAHKSDVGPRSVQ